MNAEDVHPFEQDPDATQVRVCRCGKWPDHHVHSADPCGCDICRAAGVISAAPQAKMTAPYATLSV